MIRNGCKINQLKKMPLFQPIRAFDGKIRISIRILQDETTFYNVEVGLVSNFMVKKLFRLSESIFQTSKLIAAILNRLKQGACREIPAVKTVPCGELRVFLMKLWSTSVCCIFVPWY